MTPEKYCKKIVKRSGSNFYYSFLFLPRRRRRAVYAVYALSRTIDDIADGGCLLPAKERLLAFWRQEIEEAYSGRSEHPLTRELGFAVREFDIPKEYLVEHLNGVSQDILQTRYAAYDDLKRYCYRVASVVGLICLKIFGVEDTVQNREAAIALGLAFQMTNILRDVSSDADRSRVYIPEEDLLRFHLTSQDILDKKYSADFVRLMEFEWLRANGLFEKAMAGFNATAVKKLLPAMIMAGIYHRILVEIRRIEYNVFEKRVGISTARKLLIALSAVVRQFSA